MKRIYIAGALSSKEDTNRSPSKIVTDYLSNVHKMCAWATKVRKAGYAPFVPALDLLLGTSCGEWEENDYRGVSDSFLPVCDAVLVISMSWGVQREIKQAIELGIPICYSMEELMALE